MLERNLSMLYEKLKGALDFLCHACQELDIDYTPSYEESDLQSVVLGTKDHNIVNELLDAVADRFDSDSIHIDLRRVRGGTIASISMQAINETEWDKILTAYYEEMRPMTLKNKLDLAFADTRPEIQEQTIIEPEAPVDFFKSAKKLHEAQYQSATSGITRSNQSSRQMHMFGSNETYGGVKHPNSKKRSNLQQFKESLAYMEDITGIATPTDNQPRDLFKKFGKALKVLGTQLGIGPIQDKLKEKGINWKLSSDKQSIIMFVMNATTKAPQALLRIPAEAIDQPNELEEQLMNMLDFAKGDAPGALKQKQQMIQNQEKAVRDIVQALQPEKQDDAKTVLKNMLSPTAATRTAVDVKGQI